jgi:hypothetical protein
LLQTVKAAENGSCTPETYLTDTGAFRAMFDQFQILQADIPLL